MIENVDIALGPDLAYRLTLERLLLAQRGSARHRLDRDVVERQVVLPGCIARFRWTGNGGTGQLFYGNGRPMSTRLDMNDPECFASFMHNVDVSLRRGLPNFPIAGLALADRAVRSAPPQPIADETIELDGAPWIWHPTEAIREHLDGMDLDDEGQRLKDDFLAGDALPTPVDDADWASLIRWHAQMDDWMMAATGRERWTLQVEDRQWVGIETRAGATAAARAVGVLEGKVLDADAVYALRDADRRTLAVVAVRDGRMAVHLEARFQDVVSIEDIAMTIGLLEQAMDGEAVGIGPR